MKKDKGTSKQKVSDFVEVAAQWHPTKNGDLTPDQVVTGSHQKYWWKCDKDPEHEWESVVRDRTLNAAEVLNLTIENAHQCAGFFSYFLFYRSMVSPLISICLPAYSKQCNHSAKPI